MPQLGETVAEGKVIDAEWFKSPSARRVARGRQSFRGRDRQGHGRGAGHLLRRADRDQRRGRHGRAGRGGHRRRVRLRREATAPARGAQPRTRTCEVALPHRAASLQCHRRRSSPKARARREETARPFPRSRHAAREISARRRSPTGSSPRRLRGGSPPTASIDLGSSTGSGPRGRITGRDVEKAIAARGATTSTVARDRDEPISDLYRRRPHKLVPVDGMRRTIAARLTQSKSTVPHFYLTAHIEVGRLARVRAEINESAPKDADGRTRLQALAQRFHDQGAGARLAGRAGGERHLVGRRHSCSSSTPTSPWRSPYRAGSSRRSSTPRRRSRSRRSPAR